MKRLFIILLIFSIIGIIDSGYLTLEHYQHIIPPCSTNPFLGDCGVVLRSSYAIVFGVPLALIGLVHYSVLTILLLYRLILKNRKVESLIIILTLIGLLSSTYFVYLQLIVLKAICVYCMGSAISSGILFVLAWGYLGDARKHSFVKVSSLFYQLICKPIFFLANPEIIHERMTSVGNSMGRITGIRFLASFFLSYKNKKLKQTVAGIIFTNPIGLAAGFDYDAKLTEILPALGFGFQTVGTISNHPYEGNPAPMLGRLPKSRSLMVNKGFKNLGARKTVDKLDNLSFQIPVGISIGRTNSKTLISQQQSIEDIISAFKVFEQSNISHAYYELNISCPNLYGDVTFYPPKNLQELLVEIDKMHLTRPLFIKMPIEKNNVETIAMLKVIGKHCPVGVIFGNLQKNRKDPSIDPTEANKYTVGNFSGKPTFIRSNELIRLTYQNFKKRFIIIGCGGVFNAEDAYEKITSGATLVQLITGMIYMGPQLITEINMGLVDLLDKDGFTHISEAVGSKNS